MRERIRLNLSSKIVLIDAAQHRQDVVIEGTDDFPFFTDIMGKHQWLENGNLLIAEARAGRAIEVTRDGKLVWEYFNIAGDRILGLIDDAQRLLSRSTEPFSMSFRSAAPLLAIAKKNALPERACHATQAHGE